MQNLSRNLNLMLVEALMAKELKATMNNGIGVYTYDGNPMSVPMKGSQLPKRNDSKNSDRTKVISQMDQEARKEDLRGQMG